MSVVYCASLTTVTVAGTYLDLVSTECLSHSYNFDEILQQQQFYFTELRKMRRITDMQRKSNESQLTLLRQE